jgi:hypothetical protein
LYTNDLVHGRTGPRSWSTISGFAVRRRVLATRVPPVVPFEWAHHCACSNIHKRQGAEFRLVVAAHLCACSRVCELEAETFLETMKDLKLADRHDRLVRHGHGPERAIRTGIDPDQRSDRLGASPARASGFGSPPRFSPFGHGGRVASIRCCRCSTCGAFFPKVLSAGRRSICAGRSAICGRGTTSCVGRGGGSGNGWALRAIARARRRVASRCPCLIGTSAQWMTGSSRPSGLLARSLDRMQGREKSR